MLKELTIAYVGPMSRVSFALDPRLNVFTGDNGLGKSLLLDIAYFAVSHLWPRERATPDDRQKRRATLE